MNLRIKLFDFKTKPCAINFIKFLFLSFQKGFSSSDITPSGFVRYSDVEKFLEKRTVIDAADEIIEVDDDD